MTPGKEAHDLFGVMSRSLGTTDRVEIGEGCFKDFIDSLGLSSENCWSFRDFEILVLV